MTTTESVERAQREAVRGDVVTVRWVCKYTVLRWGRRMRDVCGTEVTTATTRAEYDAREARARCPSCGGMLTQRSDGYEVVSDVPVTMQAK